MVQEIAYINLDCIDSTMTYAKKHYKNFPPQALTCLSARTQTRGTGQWHRSWFSPPEKGLYLTYFFWADAEMPTRGLSHLTSLAIAATLRKYNVAPTLKWPNDVLIAGKKISGCLVTTCIESERRAVFIGIGLNTNMALHDLQKIDQSATSLNLELQQSIANAPLKRALSSMLLHYLAIYEKQGLTPFLQKIEV